MAAIASRIAAGSHCSKLPNNDVSPSLLAANTKQNRGDKLHKADNNTASPHITFLMAFSSQSATKTSMFSIHVFGKLLTAL